MQPWYGKISESQISFWLTPQDLLNLNDGIRIDELGDYLKKKTPMVSNFI